MLNKFVQGPINAMRDVDLNMEEDAVHLVEPVSSSRLVPYLARAFDKERELKYPECGVHIDISDLVEDL